MLIHEDQQNVVQLCELADFIDSGFQSFIEQAGGKLPARLAVEAAFYAGAALALKARDHFEESAARYGPSCVPYLTGLLVEEINAYMDKNHMKLEWEPHVPRSWQQ
jgi:hypothetical protein